MAITKCLTTLIHDDGTESFTKDKEYEFHFKEDYRNYNSRALNKETQLINNQGQIHRLGLWHSQFKIIK